MIVGTTILHDGTGTTPYYTPSFPRGGLAAVFSVEATQVGGSPVSLVVKVEHKNYDETAWTTAGTFSNITVEANYTLDVQDIKEEVRLSFSFNAGALGRFVHVVIPEPAWREYS